jgi:cytochrome P450
MRRTAVADTELAGTEVAAGDKVVMWYASSNRDEAVFDDPFRFDIVRGPPHQAFGGGGPHFCLGASLARMEVRALLEEMLARDLDLELLADPIRARSNFVNGVLLVEMGTAPAS